MGPLNKSYSGNLLLILQILDFWSWSHASERYFHIPNAFTEPFGVTLVQVSLLVLFLCVVFPDAFQLIRVKTLISTSFDAMIHSFSAATRFSPTRALPWTAPTMSCVPSICLIGWRHQTMEAVIIAKLD